MDLFKKVQQYHPKVLGVDVLFKMDEPPGPLNIAYFGFADSSTSTVFACVDSGKNISHSFFILEGSKVNEGLVNFGNNGEGKPIRSILNKSKSNDKLMSFSAKVASLYDPSLPALKKVQEEVAFDLNYIPISFPNEFNAVDIVNDSINTILQKIKNKIVLIGALHDVKDNYKIPNAGFVENEKLYTHVSGLKIHAITIAMLLNDTMITGPSTFWNNFFTGLVFLIFFYILFYLFEHYEFYFKLTGRLVLLVGGILFLFLYVILMKKGIEIDLGYWVFMIILIYEMLEVYNPVMRLVEKGKKRIFEFK
jgi:CHASE2 domain-containing sensor protein